MKRDSITTKQIYCIYCKGPLSKFDAVSQAHRECYNTFIEYQRMLKKLQRRSVLHNFQHRVIFTISSSLSVLIRFCYNLFRKFWFFFHSITMHIRVAFIHSINYIKTNTFSSNKTKSQIKNFKIVWLGLNNSGKSTLIKRLTTGFIIEVQRTLGLNFDMISLEEKNFFFWDLGGMEAFRTALWKSFIAGCQGIVYVIDSADKGRLIEAKQELWNYVLSNINLKNIPVLILANKQDLANVLTIDEISDTLELFLITDHHVALYPTSAISSQNLSIAFKWIRNEVNNL